MMLLVWRKLKHTLSVNPHPPIDPLHTTWHKVDAIIKAWLLENMLPSLSDHYLKILRVKDIWHKGHHMHTKKE